MFPNEITAIALATALGALAIIILARPNRRPATSRRPEPQSSGRGRVAMLELRACLRNKVG
ncbi:hypothetical protein [Methylorubrum extorquens]|uniref:Uncharacterized protein n=1 Tax=Methylorubrum extorquens TaxID=408 RepID=A0AAX3WIQ4_METEX|nr:MULTISPECIES: hypothetical protein [Methylobacteriaceae]WHQ71398.1 hypothetical protein KEC54_07550 [Methylorubrum extorquens]